MPMRRVAEDRNSVKRVIRGEGRAGRHDNSGD
jgi:hypothetical protein